MSWISSPEGRQPQKRTESWWIPDVSTTVKSLRMSEGSPQISSSECPSCKTRPSEHREVRLKHSFDQTYKSGQWKHMSNRGSNSPQYDVEDFEHASQRYSQHSRYEYRNSRYTGISLPHRRSGKSRSLVLRVDTAPPSTFGGIR